jgi:hypothetical protein
MVVIMSDEAGVNLCVRGLQTNEVSTIDFISHTS